MCSNLLPESRFYYLGYVKKKSGEKALSSYCNQCNSKRVNKNKSPKPYKPRNQYKDIREEILVEDISIYNFVKKVSKNNLKLDYIDTFRLVSLYIDLFGNDIPDYYCEKEQLEIMYYKLEKYTLNLGPQCYGVC
jgi:hypothetical protein